MKVSTQITVAVDVQDTVAIYSNLKQNLTRILSDKYVGRCLRGYYIESIDELVRVSHCYITQDGDPTYGTINVIMKVTATVYNHGEVIVGARVVKKIANSHFVLQYDRAAIMVYTTPALESITVGQMMSIQVIMTRYDLMATAVSVFAKPYVPMAMPNVYAIEPADTTILGPELERADRLESEIKEAAKLPSYDFFVKLLEPAGDYAEKTIPIRDLIKTTAIVTRAGCPATSAVVAVEDKAEVSTHIPTADAILLLLQDYNNHLQVILDHIRTYNTVGLIKSHDNIWKLIAALKLKPHLASPETYQ